MKEYLHRVSGTPALSLEDVPQLPQNPSKPQDLSAQTDSIYIIYTSGKASKLLVEIRALFDVILFES